MRAWLLSLSSTVHCDFFENLSRYEGKIAIVLLTEQELLEERERMAKNEGYLKLPYKCEDCIVGFDHEQTLISHVENRHTKVRVFSFK